MRSCHNKGCHNKWGCYSLGGGGYNKKDKTAWRMEFKFSLMYPCLVLTEVPCIEILSIALMMSGAPPTKEFKTLKTFCCNKDLLDDI